MFRKFSCIALVLLFVLIISIPASGAESQAVSLDKAFNQSVVMPYAFKGAGFVNGNLNTKDDSTAFKNYIVNGTMFSSVKAVAYLLQDEKNYWNVNWDAGKPKIVTLKNTTGNKVVITVGSKTMQVNGKNLSLAVPAKTMNGNVVLPLKAIVKAVNMNLNYTNGMIIVSKVSVDIASNNSKEVVNKAKILLNSFTSANNDVEKNLIPLGYYNGGYYAEKNYFDYAKQKWIHQMFYCKDGRATEVKLKNVSYINYNSANKVGNSMYYITTSTLEVKLYRWDLDSGNVVQVAALKAENGESFDPEFYLKEVKEFNNNIYVVCHSGDGTMGNDVVYELVNGKLVQVVDLCRNISAMVEAGAKLYFTDADFTYITDKNLYCLDLTNNAVTNIGWDGYTYNVIRGGSSGWMAYGNAENGAGLLANNDYVYSMIYKEASNKNNRNLVKISTIDSSQVILPVEVQKFWLVSEGIVYAEYTSGKLMKCDFNGENAKVLADNVIDKISVNGDDIYYTVADKNGLYHLNVATGVSETLSYKKIAEIIINKTGVYFTNNSYDAGLYKIVNSKSVQLVGGFICSYANTDDGVLYNKRVSPDVYLAK